jgi:hypothetical protein
MTRNQSGRRRTPQQRKRDAQTRRAEESASTNGSQPAVEDADDVNSTPAQVVDQSAGTVGTRRRRGLTEEQLVAFASTQWSVRGRLTLALIIAILILPFGTLQYLTSHGGTVNVTGHGDLHYSFAYFLVIGLAPLSLIPIQLLLATFLGMPLARALAHEKRNLRVLETLGFVAVVFLTLTLTWGPLPKSAASYTDPKVVAAAGLADAVGLVAGAYLYGPLSYFLSPARRMRKR